MKCFKTAIDRNYTINMIYNSNSNISETNMIRTFHILSVSKVSEAWCSYNWKIFHHIWK